MKVTPFWAAIALLEASTASAASSASELSTTPTATTPATCTASLITKLCDYPSPGPYAVASDGRPSCWQYCNAHQPCDFVIFVAGNPYTGTGTCWVYPGESFDASKGRTDCANPGLFVYSKPVCSGGDPDTTGPGACAATASPSAVASVCGYPPPGDCWDGCAASSGASHCLSYCAKADACSYAVFNPHNSLNSQYHSGTCWIYPNGTYDAASTKPCSGAPEQYVYNNVCPKPSHSPSATADPATGSGGVGASGTKTTDTPATGTAGGASGTRTVGGSSGTGTSGGASTTETAVAMPAVKTSSRNLAPTGLSLSHPLAVGVAALVWQGGQLV